MAARLPNAVASAVGTVFQPQPSRLDAVMGRAAAIHARIDGDFITRDPPPALQENRAAWCETIVGVICEEQASFTP